jgi:ABC-type polysaccharide/polyol phosphate transport system ATPase subunit
MSVDNSIPQPPHDHSPVPPAERPLAIQVEGLVKSFQIPTHRVDSLKERIVQPFSGREHRELQALRGISFEIQQGEFFGIVGRNGSGKSTLLKLLASIYRADAGTIRMAGRLAPFIELGVGFNVELTARENVLLNGVMMGLKPGEAGSRLDAILEFAELEEFVDL